MKYEITESYKNSVLLSELDLQNNDFNENWLNGFFLNPIIEGLNIFDANGNLEEKDIYISFGEFEMPKMSNHLFFPQLHKEIKQYIFTDWGIKNTVYPIYNFYLPYSEDKNKKKVLFIFLSPNRTNKLFDFNLVPNKDKLIQNFLEMLLKATYLEKINYKVPFNADICSGKFFLSPQISERKDKHFVNVFSYSLNFKDLKLGFSLKNEHYRLNNNLKSIHNYDDVCLINKFKYEKKVDSREHGRLFLDFKNYEKLKVTKFINQLDLYKNLLNTLDRFNINYEKTCFSPDYLYNSFSYPSNELKELNVYIESKEKELFEQALLDKGVYHGLNGLLEYIGNSFNMKVSLILNPTLDMFLKNKKTSNLFLMYGEQYEEKYVQFKSETKEEKWNNILTPFMEKKLYELGLNDFLKEIKNFDTYSQVKLFNIYANIKKIEPIVSQGLILDKSIIFEKPKKVGEELVSIEGNTKKTEKKYPENGTISVIAKVINELNIKHSLFSTKTFNFDIAFEKTKKCTSFDSIKIIQMLSKEKNKFFAVLDLKKVSEQGSKGNFNIESSRVLIDEQINELNLEFDLNEEFMTSDNLIIIDNKFLIKVKDNDLMPFMILQESHFDEPTKNPLLLANASISKGEVSSVSRKSGPDDNLFYPYILPALNKIIDKKLKNINSYANCLLDFNGENGLNLFMSYGSAMDATMDKNNRLENITLSKIEDFSIQKLDWEEHEQLLYFYLSTLTFNYLNINELTKKSLLNKLSDVILVN
jgi:hypothetical protein